MKWVDGAWPGESMTLSSGAFRSDENGLLWLRTSTDYPPPRFCLTLNIGEKPMEPNPTKLSQILETETDPKYRLSAKACQGILNRAERRGKELPSELKAALMEQAAMERQDTDTGNPESNLSEQKERTGQAAHQTSCANLTEEALTENLLAAAAKKKMETAQSAYKETVSTAQTPQDVTEPDGGGGVVTLLTQSTDPQLSVSRNEQASPGGQWNPYPD